MAIHTADAKFADLEIRIFPRRDEKSSPQDEGSSSQDKKSYYPVKITVNGEQEFNGKLDANIVVRDPGDIPAWSPTGDTAVDGRGLFHILFQDDLLKQAWFQTRGQKPKYRIRLCIEPQAVELHALPWELLQEDLVTLSAQADTPFSRYLPIKLPWSGAVDQRPIRVLVAISNPDNLKEKYGLPQADVALERKALVEAFAGVEKKDLEVTFMEAPITLERIEEELRKGYHIFHYLGHGSFNAMKKQAILYLQDANGHVARTDDKEITSMVVRQPQEARPRLIFLAACHSAAPSSANASAGLNSRLDTDDFVGLGPKLVSVGVPAVIAMQDVVSVETARKFSREFYRRLLNHGLVDLAVNEARSTVLTNERFDAAVPVLFMRLPSGALWSAEADARGTISEVTDPDAFWADLMRHIKNRECTPVIGPRVHHDRWLPTPDQIAQQWARTLKYPFPDTTDLARVGQYQASRQGEYDASGWLLNSLREGLIKGLIAHVAKEQWPQDWPRSLRLRDNDAIEELARQYETLTSLVDAIGWPKLVADDPNEVHQVLARLRLPIYLTTNCDNFMVAALTNEGVSPERAIFPWKTKLNKLPSRLKDDSDYKPSSKEPLVCHVFGSDQARESLVFTENQYLDFLVQVSKNKVIDKFKPVTGALTGNMLLFIGYGLQDWEFRVFMRGLVATFHDKEMLHHVTVQLDDTSEAKKAVVHEYLDKHLWKDQTHIYWGSTAQFIAELRERWEKRQ